MQNQVLGITGGIGAGKSIVSGVLKHLGLPVFDSDQYAKNAYTDSEEVQMSVVRLLGSQAYGVDLQPNRPYIAQKVFSSPELLLQLEQILHPYVRRSFLEWKHSTETRWGWLGIESAILIDKGFDDLCDAVLYVDAPEHIRIERVQQRDKQNIDAIKRRIEQQKFDYSNYRTLPFYTICNSGHTPILPQLKELITTLKQFSNPNLFDSEKG